MVTLSFTIFSGQKNYNRAHMLFQVLCGFEPIFYTTHPNEESDIFKLWDDIEVNFAKVSKELNRRYGSKPYSNYGKDNVKKISMFSNVEMDYTVPKGIMIQLLEHSER